MSGLMTLNQPQQFCEIYGSAPTHEVISPGRVNIIGEHTDYNQLPVLPMAIGAGIHMLIKANTDGMVRARNTDPSFPPVEFPIGREIEPSEAGHWGNYVKAAIQGTYDVLASDGAQLCGFDALVDSTLPPAAGLSSSSALVVGAYRAFSALNGKKYEPIEEAEMMRKAERYVGTAGGGMDQTCITMGREGHALFIEFDPLRARYVPVPKTMSFFAVNSLKRAPKAGSVRFEYNRRSFECQAGLLLMRNWMVKEGAKNGASDELVKRAAAWTSLRDAWRDMKHEDYCMERCILAAIGNEAWSLAKYLNTLGEEGRELLRTKMLPEPNEKIWNDFAGFPLHARVQHVVSETNRVYECVEALEKGSIPTVARLVSESHASCRDLYHISTPALEQLVRDSLTCGALAARITGAGFGGSIIVMVDPSEAKNFPQKLWERYFRPLISRGELPEMNMQDVIIECLPGDGAHARKLEE